MREWKMRHGRKESVENAGVENAGANSRDEKCRSKQAVWKAETKLYIERPLSYFLKLS